MNYSDIANSESGKYAAFFVKPDAMQYFLGQQIIQDIEDTGLRVVFRKEITITEHDVPRLYPDHAKTDEFPSIVKLYEMGPTMLLIVEDERSDEHPDIFQRVREVKGKAREGGIRDKYLLGRREDLEARGLSGRELMDELAKNRVHATDNQEEMDLLVDMFISPTDIGQIKQYYEDLAKELGARFEIVPASKERK